jgi:hypothetical protein
MFFLFVTFSAIALGGVCWLGINCTKLMLERDFILNYLKRNEGGIYKRIDELREDLIIIHERAPELFISHPWIASHMKMQDDFLVNLALLAKIAPSECATCRDWLRPFPDSKTFADPRGTS